MWATHVVIAVVVGVTATALAPSFLTPMSDRRMPGAEYQANVLEMLLHGRSIVPLAPLWQALLTGAMVLLVTLCILSPGVSGPLLMSIGGVAVSPGDAVLADDCGVLVVPPSQAEGLVDTCLADQADEGSWLERLRGGAKLQDLVDISAMIAERNGKDEAAHG